MRSRKSPKPNLRLITDSLHALFENFPDGFILVDERKRIIAINPATQKIMGWTPAEVIGKKTCDLFFCCEDTRNCPIPSEKHLPLDAKKKTNTGRIHETAPLNKTGRPRKVSLSCSLLATSSDEPFRVMIIIRDITRTKKREETLRELSIQDSLTGLYNHSFFVNQLTKEINRSQRYLHPVSLLMVDVDDFKRYNDTYGHLRGDRLLIKVAKIMRNKVRSIDFVARYGGEEYSVILLETDKKAAYLIAEKLRKEVRRKCSSGPTISVGVATCPDDATKAQSLIKKADLALYLAKNSGKDLVRVFTTSKTHHSILMSI